MLEAFSGRWAVPIHIKETTFPYDLCKVTTVYLGVPTAVAVFTWAISLLLFLSTAIRIAQALASNGKYLLRTRYDIAGLGLKPEHPARLNGLQVLLGVRLWKPHFKLVFLNPDIFRSGSNPVQE